MMSPTCSPRVGQAELWNSGQGVTELRGEMTSSSSFFSWQSTDLGEFFLMDLVFLFFLFYTYFPSSGTSLTRLGFSYMTLISLLSQLGPHPGQANLKSIFLRADDPQGQVIQSNWVKPRYGSNKTSYFLFCPKMLALQHLAPKESKKCK